MIPVPSYQLVMFLEWLQHREFHISRSGRGDLLEYANIFIKEIRRGEYRPREGFVRDLYALMQLFQNCPMIRETTIHEQMHHFSTCGRCASYMSLSSSDRDMHPLLSGFTEYASTDLKSTIRNCNGELRTVIRASGHQLREEFFRYLDEVANKSLINSYMDYRLRNRREHTDAPTRENNDEGLQRFIRELGEPYAAQRLADSVSMAIDSGYYDDEFSSQPHVLRLISSVSETPKELSRTLEFLSWLRNREPELNILGNIPSEQIESLVRAFCDQFNYTNSDSFAREVRKQLSGNAPRRILERIARFFGIKYAYSQSNPLSRYRKISFHGIFLFLASGDFSGFIEKHWHDLNILTGDHLDIYYSNKEIEERTSGHEIVNELHTIQVRVTALPAILLWSNELKEAMPVSLYGLSHDDIVQVMQSIVQAIKDGKILSDIVATGSQCARTVNKLLPSIHLAEQATLVIQQGGLVMGDSYTNIKGTVGAMGPNAIVQNATFIHDARSALSDVSLGSEMAPLIEKLAQSLAASEIAGVPFAERLKGAQHLTELAGAVKNQQGGEEPLAQWKQWLSNLGEKASSVLGTLAKITEVARPIAKILGLPV